MSFHAHDERIVYLDLELETLKLRLTSAYLPHGDFPEEYYESELQALEGIILSARRSKKMNVVGIDANAVIGRQEVTDDAQVIGEFGMRARNDRSHIFAAWLHGQRLAVASSMKLKHWDEAWTHELWSTRVRRQIDYIL